MKPIVRVQAAAAAGLYCDSGKVDTTPHVSTPHFRDGPDGSDGRVLLRDRAPHSADVAHPPRNGLNVAEVSVRAALVQTSTTHRKTRVIACSEGNSPRSAVVLSHASRDSLKPSNGLTLTGNVPAVDGTTAHHASTSTAVSSTSRVAAYRGASKFSNKDAASSLPSQSLSAPSPCSTQPATVAPVRAEPEGVLLGLTPPNQIVTCSSADAVASASALLRATTTRTIISTTSARGRTPLHSSATPCSVISDGSSSDRPSSLPRANSALSSPLSTVLSEAALSNPPSFLTLLPHQTPPTHPLGPAPMLLNERGLDRSQEDPHSLSQTQLPSAADISVEQQQQQQGCLPTYRCDPKHDEKLQNHAAQIPVSSFAQAFANAVPQPPHSPTSTKLSRPLLALHWEPYCSLMAPPTVLRPTLTRVPSIPSSTDRLTKELVCADGVPSLSISASSPLKHLKASVSVAATSPCSRAEQVSSRSRRDREARAGTAMHMRDGVHCNRAISPLPDTHVPFLRCEEVYPPTPISRSCALEASREEVRCSSKASLPVALRSALDTPPSILSKREGTKTVTPRPWSPHVPSTGQLALSTYALTMTHRITSTGSRYKLLDDGEVAAALAPSGGKPDMVKERREMHRHLSRLKADLMRQHQDAVNER